MKFRLCAALAALLWLTAPVRADSGDERILSARDAASRGDTTRLATLAEHPGNHVLEPYIQYWLLSARLARSSEPVPTDTINDFLQQNNNTWLAERLRQDWLKRLARDTNWGNFQAEYLLLAQPDQDLQCSAVLAGGDIAIDAQRTVEAQWLNWLDVPDSCARVYRALVDSGRFGTEDIWQRFRRQVETKRYTPARQTLSWLQEGAVPNSNTLAQVFDNPTRYLASANAQSPGSRAERELTMAAITRLSRTDPRDALARWRTLSSGAYRDEDRAYVAGQLGWGAALSQLDEALPLYLQAKGVAMSDEQRAWNVRAALRAGDWAAVRMAIEAMPAPLCDQPEWVYWQGRALSQLGRQQEARALFSRYAGQASFYGILSAEALGQTVRWPASKRATSQELANVQANGGIRRALALWNIGMRTESVREWNWVLRSADDRFLLAAAEYARSIDLYDRAINTAERTREQHDYALRYLAPYYDTFSRYANDQGLNLAWVYGLTRQESRFQPVARSGAGAQGLMQVMPATGKWIAKKQGWRDYDGSWLARVDTNIQVGCAYLRHIMDLLGNQMVVASAAYNAGPGRARRWQSSQPMEGAIYAETIPITETRDYVKKVMANSVLYDTLLTGHSSSLLKRLGKVSSGGEMALGSDEPNP